MILGIDGRLANADQPAGAGHYCREVLRALRALPDGPQLRIYLDREARPLFEEWGDIRVLPAQPFWTHRALADELHRDPPDVFFTPVTQLPWRCPCPTLVSVLDLAVRRYPRCFPWRKRMGMALKTRHAVHHADHFIAISEATATDLRHFYGVHASRVTVAPLGVSEAYRNAGNRDLPRPSCLSEIPDAYILYVGQIQPRKNLGRLIDAFEKLCEAHPDLPHHLVLAGADGWQPEATHRVAATSPVAHRIHLLGYIPEADLPALMAHADVLTLVSQGEGFGLPVVEAMAAGTAVLAADSASLPEILGDAGVLVKPTYTAAITEGLAKLLNDTTLRATCEARGKARAAQFTWTHCATTIARAAGALTSGD